MVEMQRWFWNKRNVFMNIYKLTYKMRILFTCVVSIGMTAGCNDAYEQQSTDNEASSFISVHTNVDSKVGEDNAERAQLLFWDEETFHGAWIENKENNENNETLPSPRFVSILDNEIDYYKNETGIAFNTKQEYPAGEDATIHATGYYPAAALSPKTTDDKPDYSLLLVQTGYSTGKVDFMTCDGCVEHSASRDYPFTNSDKELKFRHLMACIRFRGERDESMEHIVGVKNVYITVYNESELYVPTIFNLYTINSETNSEDKSTYIIGENPYAPPEISIHYPDIINMGEQRELGACYVVSHGLNYNDPSKDYYVDPFGKTDYEPVDETSTPELKIKVTADFYSISGGQTASTTETWNLVIKGDMWYDDDNKNTCTTGDKFIPGYMYDILLHFKRSGVTVRAEAVPWEDGGIHVHPVQPKTNP